MPKIDRDALKRLRESRGMTQESLAQKAGVSPRTIQRMEATGNARIEMLGYVANVLKVDLEMLLLKDVSDSQAEQPFALCLLQRVDNASAFLSTCCEAWGIMPRLESLAGSGSERAAATLMDEVRDLVDIWCDLSFSGKLDAAEAVRPTFELLRSQGWWVFAYVHVAEVAGITNCRLAIVDFRRADEESVMLSPSGSAAGVFAMVPRKIDTFSLIG